MLTQIGIQRYKSLYDVTIDLQPLTVFIGPNGAGKSNVCEALFVLSHVLHWIGQSSNRKSLSTDRINEGVARLPNNQQWPAKFWQGQTDFMAFKMAVNQTEQSVEYAIQFHGIAESLPQPIFEMFRRVVIYDFSPTFISQEASDSFEATGHGIANTLAAILLDDRERFNELEARLIELVPNIARISLKHTSGGHQLRLVDKYSDHLIPASDISDGTLRVLAFLTALYDVDTPSIICFEEPENGIHPWLLHKIVELLNRVSCEGVAGQPVQVLVTTHSPVLLNYVKPEQVRAVELDAAGKTKIHPLPTQSARFQAAMTAYDGELGELWFTNLFGGNPD